MFRTKKGVRPQLPERPEGSFARLGPDPLFDATVFAGHSLVVVRKSIQTLRSISVARRWRLIMTFAMLIHGFSLSGCGRRIAEEPTAASTLSPSTPAGSRPIGNSQGKPPTDQQAEVFARVERAESDVLNLTQQIKPLSQDILNLQFPVTSKPLFAERVDVIDLAPQEPRLQADQESDLALQVVQFAVSDAKVTQRPEDLSLWKPLISKVQFFDHAKFYIIDGDFAPDSEYVFNTKCGFAALARLTDGSVAELKGKIDVQWKRPVDSESRQWQIVHWKTKSLQAVKSPQTWFTDVLRSVVPDPQVLAQLNDSAHKRLAAYAIDQKCDCAEEIKNLITLAYQTIAVTDLNGDNWDDLFLSAYSGKCVYLENQRDGTLSNLAETRGLDIEGPVTAACFADFDNDGDIDAFFGKRDEPACYYENDNGTFALKETYDVKYVTSIASADYNKDGLLDVYFTTYDGVNQLRPFESSEEVTPESPAGWRVTNFYSLPNVLLTNRGKGKFARNHDNDPVVSIRRASFQSAWSDYDNDGYPDLYIANDFSPNVMLKNYGGKFVDVTNLTGTADVGFGMGASWGDYDNDGKQDLYVTNMYSKAGVRITSKLSGLLDETRKAARGNSLFHNEGTKFTKVSGSEPDELAVEQAGWSWGSQFVDINNDGFLDLHALSGYYTPPPRYQLPDDL